MHQRKLKTIIAAAICSLAASAAFATPKALEEGVRSGQLKILKQFEAVSGLTGWVIAPGQDAPGMKPLIMYTTADGKTLITGMPVLVDEAGRNLSTAYDDAHIPKPDFSATYEKLSTAKTVSIGTKGDNPVYVFYDANCIYCNFISKALDPYVAKGADIRHVPVAFLRPDSAGKAAAIVNAANPHAALQENTAKFRAGGIAPAEVSPELRAALEANAALMSEIGASGTPAILYRDAKGEVKMIGGMPKLSQIPEIVRMDEIPNDDPELARFK